MIILRVRQQLRKHLILSMIVKYIKVRDLTIKKRQKERTSTLHGYREQTVIYIYNYLPIQ